MALSCARIVACGPAPVYGNLEQIQECGDLHLLGVVAGVGFGEVEDEIGAAFCEPEQGLRAAIENVIRGLMAELLQGFEDLFAVVLYRLLLAFLLPLALARRGNFFLHFSRFFFPQVVQHGDFQFRSMRPPIGVTAAAARLRDE